MTKLVISRMKVTPHAGGKAKFDVRAICEQMGFAPFDMSNEGSRTAKALRSLREGVGLGARLLTMGERDVTLTQLPVGQVVGRASPRLGRRWKIGFVHDIESLRQHQAPGADVTSLGRYDVVVVHSEPMKAWVEEQLRQPPPVVVLGMFDYLTRGEVSPAERSAVPSRLYVVGNLRPDKAGYLYALGPTALPVEAFGPECDQGRLPTHVSWLGSIDPETPRLPRVDGFGLMWDGASPDGLDRPGGPYLRYNAPHKLSFYVAAGLPVVVPADSAMAGLVASSGIGLTASTVHEAAEQASACSSEQWHTMCEAVSVLREKVTTGWHTRRAIGRALDLGEAQKP